MGGPAMDLYGNPLGAVRVLFEKSCRNAVSAVELTQSDWGIQDVFQSHLYGQNGHTQVPELNSVTLDAIPVNTLVRFRGMIQDMFDVEYFIGAYKDHGVWHTTKYTDVADVPSGSESEAQMWDRRLLYCVPVPGENLWVKEACSAVSSIVREDIPSRSLVDKRLREDSNGEGLPEDMESDGPILDSGSDTKRLRGDTEASMSLGETSGSEFDLNMPLNSVGGKKLLPCLVKVYDGHDADLKLNEIVEFFGVLTFDPELSTASFSVNGGESGLIDGIGSAFLEDHVSVRLPASKVPRLQCITLRKMCQYNPSTQALGSPRTMSTPEILQTRQSLVNYLSISLGDDVLAAEYLLLHLLSQVHARVDSMALGKLSLNLTGCNPGLEGSPSPVAITAADTIAKLVPRSHFMPLSLTTLNQASIAPRKDYVSNRLVTGPMQLANGTHLTLDETTLQAGALNAVGVQNVDVLKHLLQWQKVEYDFQFYKMEMLVDVPVLVLSQAKSRILPTDVVVPLNPTSTPDTPNVTDMDFTNWRRYLAIAREMDHSLDLSMQKRVEDDLVAARQEDRTLGPETFHRWLTMARLMSVSYLEPTLLPQRWQMVQDLEQRCAVRLRCL